MAIAVRGSQVMPRNYQEEYRNDTPKRKRERASRNRARYRMMKSGRAAKGDGKDVDHRNGNALDNSAGNLSVIGRARNLAKQRK